MQDVVFDFNAREGWKERSLDGYNEKEHWFPKLQHSLDSTYPGGYDLYNPYFMGFYGGITIECSGVIQNQKHFIISKHFSR